MIVDRGRVSGGRSGACSEFFRRRETPEDGEREREREGRMIMMMMMMMMTMTMTFLNGRNCRDDGGENVDESWW